MSTQPIQASVSEPVTKLPRSGTRRYSVEFCAAGQPRPYADTIYEFDLRVEWIPYGGQPRWEPNDLNDDLIVKAARAIGHDWKDKPDWHEATLKSKTKIGPGHWRFKVTLAYTD